jgi:hypothetical protein
MKTKDLVESAAKTLRGDNAITGGTFEDGSIFKRDKNYPDEGFIHRPNIGFTTFKISTGEILPIDPMGAKL